MTEQTDKPERPQKEWNNCIQCGKYKGVFTDNGHCDDCDPDHEKHEKAIAAANEHDEQADDEDDDDDEDDGICEVCGEEPHECECTDEEIEEGRAIW